MLIYTIYGIQFIIIINKIILKFGLIFFWQRVKKIYLGWQKRGNRNTNIFVLKKKGDYKYKYIWVDKKKSEYNYKYSSHIGVKEWSPNMRC